jgi:Protein of unknown function (DUF1566)
MPKSLCQFTFPPRCAVRGLVTGLVLLTSVAMAEAQKFPATGQTRCYNSAGAEIDCAGTGQDGDIQAGAPLRYKDNGNGTITDKSTDLTWEKKSDDGTIHDVDNTYTWENAFAVHVAALNNSCKNDATVDCSVNGDADCAGVGGKCGFAGKRDWRVPNARELASIGNYENVDPAVSAAFNTNCVAGATVLTGSCTATSLFYWSSTSDTGTPSNAAVVHFLNGSVPYAAKSDPIHVRAVRGGR